MLTWVRWTHSDQNHCSHACRTIWTSGQQTFLGVCTCRAECTNCSIAASQICSHIGTHLWLGRFTGLGAVTFPRDTMRLPGLLKQMQNRVI